MIEQTDLIVTTWQYQEPTNPITDDSKLTSSISFDVMKKRAATKKGIACRFSCEFAYENQPILEYVGEDSYVIDLEDVVDMAELHTMIRNSYSKFKDKFDLRKLGTILSDKTLVTIDETKYNLEPVLQLLV